MRYNRIIPIAIGFALTATGCLNANTVEPRVVYYYPSTRQAPHEPVYSRLTWSHLPNPIPAQSNENSPLLSPVISFELPNSTLEGAVEALGQTIGYEWKYPADLAARKVSIKQVGTVEELLQEIGRQARVETRLDHEHRLLIVEDTRAIPRLPGDVQSNTDEVNPSASGTRRGSDAEADDYDRFY